MKGERKRPLIEAEENLKTQPAKKSRVEDLEVNEEASAYELPLRPRREKAKTNGSSPARLGKLSGTALWLERMAWCPVVFHEGTLVRYKSTYRDLFVTLTDKGELLDTSSPVRISRGSVSAWLKNNGASKKGENVFASDPVTGKWISMRDWDAKRAKRN